MNFKEFKEYYEKLNDKETEKYWEYGEAYTWVEYISWKYKINFLDKFIKVFDDYVLWEVIVDEYIWFITNWEDIYINEEFLDFCIKNKLKKENAYDFYYKNLYDNMGENDVKDFISYEESFKNFKKKKCK